MNRRLSGGGIITLAGGLRQGDNVVFQTDNPEGYSDIADAIASDMDVPLGSFHFISFVRQNERFNISAPDISLIFCDPSAGFEEFVESCCAQVQAMQAGDVLFLDCLTSLMGFWGSDWLIGYAYQLILSSTRSKRITTFTFMQRKCHRQFTVRHITDSASVIVRVMRDNMGRTCLVPSKAQDRSSVAMYKPYVLEPESGVRPVLTTPEAARLQNPPDRRSDMQYFNCLDRLFLGDENADGDKAVRKLCQVLMGMDSRIHDLAAQYLTLDELKIIRKRTIGSGFIGGKAAGMIIGRKIIQKDVPEISERILFSDDSFFLGADAFYTYLIFNGIWDDYKSYSCEPDGAKSRKLHRLILNGEMPPEINERLEDLVDYYGHFPIIVRSSSLLEDSFDSSFAGKYESCFCILSGDDSQMLGQLGNVVKSVYASMFNREVDSYRKVSRLRARADVMSVVIQRVSGVYQGDFFFPHIAGVGHSYNSYIWDRKIDPESGLLRLVAGLGTRAVSRGNSDYARMVAINRPNDYPMPGLENKKIYSQKYIDVIDSLSNRIRVIRPSELDAENVLPSMKIIAARDTETEKVLYRTTGKAETAWMIDYDYVINKTDFISAMSKMLKALETAYKSPVEIEFTVIFTDDENYVVNLLQCRPVQVQKISNEEGAAGEDEYTVFRAKGTFLGGSNSLLLDTVVYVNWEEYVKLPPVKKRECADYIGILNARIKRKEFSCLLLGYGRWGSSVTALGVPVEFSHIDGMKAIIEIGKIEKGLVPELSYGTHFFHDVVESKITYICVLEDKENFYMDETITKAPNMIRKAIEEPEGLEKVIGYFRFPKKPLRLVTDIRSRIVTVYRENG